MAETRELSRDTYERLKAELEELTGAGRIEIAQKIEAARALGDLSENGDYHAAKDQQGKMEARIRQIQGILLDAVVVEGGTSDGSVTVGSVVGIAFDPDDESDVEKYLVGHIEERHDEFDVLSPESPLGSSLLGKRAGDRAEYEVNGNSLTVKIVSVE
jgi:transcription elongation factor GreA